MGRLVTSLTVMFLGVAAFAPIALGGHANESCTTKQETSVAENSSPSGSRTGVSGTIRVVDPNPAVDAVIVRSIYIVKNSTNADFIEFGWKWLVDASYASPDPDDDVDPRPQPFAVRVVNGTYNLSEGNHAGIWELMNAGSNHTFRIEANIDGSHPNTFYFYRDGNGPGSFFHAGMQDGFVLSASEAQLCNSLSTHHWALRRLTGDGWNGWTNTVKQTGSPHPDNSKWWYFDRLATDEYQLDHCASANCGDVN